MDFFEHQEKARRNTSLLVLYFALAVAGIVLAVYGIVAVIFLRGQLWHPQVFLGVTAGVVGVVTIGSLSKLMELSSGGSSVATMLGGTPVNPNTRDPDERKLLNVVEEMAIASGVPVPPVYVMNHEAGINAFAAGYSPSDAVVGVTRGCIQQLNREELQGVIAHEFSHILNGDMRLNIRLMGLIFGIMCLAVVGRILLYTRGGSSRDRNALPIVGLGLLAVGGLGVLFGRLMQSAVSRQREFLADASAVQFTRNPLGLASALKKIGALAQGSRMESAHALEANHLFFSNGASALAGLFASHPPLEERIRLLDPAFDGDFSKVSRRIDVVKSEAAPARSQRPPILFPFPGRADQAAALAGLTQSPRVVNPEALMPSIGVPAPEHLRYAAEFREAIPAALREAATDALAAQAMVLALLLSRDESTCGRQIQLIAQRGSNALASETQRMSPAVASAAVQARLPLVDVALPALRLMSPMQFSAFRRMLQEVIESDRQVDLFEFVLLKIVMRHLEPHFLPVRKPVVQFYELKPLVPDAVVLLSALAYLGAENLSRATAAFARGAQAFAHASGRPLSLLSREQCGLAAVEAALGRFAAAAPQMKKNVLNACAQTVAADGVIHEREAELLRAIGDSLDCPLPPMVGSGGI
jgi:Zn-dependent protease with chaperone function